MATKAVDTFDNSGEMGWHERNTISWDDDFRVILL